VPRPRKPRSALPPHVHAVRSRGRNYYYFQPFRNTSREVSRVALPGAPFTPDGTPDAAWWSAYRELSRTTAQHPAGTFSALITDFTNSTEWNELSPKTQQLWRPLLARVEDAWSSLSVAGVKPRHVLALRDSYADRPGAANNLMRALSSMMTWSIPQGWRETNPCADLRKLKVGSGYEPWTWREIEHFHKHARVDLWHGAAIALYTGQRQADVIAMKWNDIDRALIAVVQEKTGKRLWIPMHENLRVLLAEIPRVSITILTSSRRVPWTSDGFRHVWADQLASPIMAPLRERRRVFHGLRKSAVVFLLEAGCSDAEVSAITGQSREMVEHYAREVNQRKLAATAILKWQAATQTRTENERDDSL
jgi:integrase